MGNINQGDVCLVNFNTRNRDGNVQIGYRPAVVVQNNVGNKFSPTTLVVPMTSRIRKNNLPTHVFVPAGEGGIQSDSMVLAEQIMTIDKDQINRVIGCLSAITYASVESAMRVSLGMCS